ncbi:MAG: SIMPL domain-containing protein [Flavobacteriales bacterium]|nr:SIMPL domain-containing protein [Flavobacteriales bacterium]
MKRVTLIIAFIYLAFNANAIEVRTELNRIITVTGSAEIVIPPDEIELEITLTENNSWKSLSKIELAFMKLLFGNDIEKDRVVFNSTNSSFYWYYWWHHRRDSRKSKKIILKLDAKTNFMKLVRDLDKEYVTSIRITKTSNKDLQKFRREVKIEAIKAAKPKQNIC